MTVGLVVWAYTLLLPSFADIGLVGPRHPHPGAVGHLAAAAAGDLFGLDLPPLVHGVFWSLSLNVLAYVGVSLARAPARSSGCRPTCSFRPTPAPIAPSFRPVALVGDGRGADRDGRRAISARSARALVRAASRRPGGSASIRRHDADFHLLRYAEHLLASAIGAASSRLVLSLLLRKRTVSTEAALKLLDDANAAIQYNREILQTALDHVRQGIAVFDKDLQPDLLEPAVRRHPRPAARIRPRRHRARRDPAPQCRARRARAGRDRGRWCASAIVSLRVGRRAVPGALRRARPRDRSARQPRCRTAAS